MSIDFNLIPSPSYLLVEEKLIKNLIKLKKVKEKAGVKIILALKGYALWKSFPVVKKYLDGATASSLFEARLCYDEMGTKAHLCSPAYIESEFKNLMQYCSHITFNSLSQWKKFSPRIKKSTYKISSGLRINPEISSVEYPLYNPCTPGTRLGITSEKLPEKLPDGIEGLHFHTLCESDSFALEKTLQVIEKNFSHSLKKIKWINMGGGHLITRENYDTEHLIFVLKKFKKKWAIEIILEPGEAIGWQTGYLVSTILDIVENEGIKTLILDISFTAHTPDCLEMPYTPQLLGATNAQEGKPVYRLGGLSCLSGDFVGDYTFAIEPKTGDKLILYDMIHYTMVKTTMFNGVNLPSIGIWTKEGKFKLLKRFRYKDYKSRLS